MQSLFYRNPAALCKDRREKASAVPRKPASAERIARAPFWVRFRPTTALKSRQKSRPRASAPAASVGSAVRIGVWVDDERSTDGRGRKSADGHGAAEEAGHESAAAKLHESFAITAAASLQDVRRLILKHGDSFGVFDKTGDALSGPGIAEGLFHRDTRHLSHFAVTVEGARPLLLSSTLRDDNATLTCDLTNPDLFDEPGHLQIEHDLIHLRRSRFLWRASCFERLSIRNFDNRRRRIRVAVAFAADFADLFEVRGMHRRRRGEVEEPVIDEGAVTLSYVGLDDRRRSTTLRFDPGPATLSGRQAVYTLDLDPRESASIFIEIVCLHEEAPLPPLRAFFIGLRDARRELRAAASGAATVETSNDIFNEAARRSIADLYMLMTRLPEGLYPYAGIPWFSAVFGRDAIITALEMLWPDPSVARGVLRHLAATQATGPTARPTRSQARFSTRRGTARWPISARCRSAAIMAASIRPRSSSCSPAQYLERTGDLETIRELWPQIVAALDWIERYGDRDGDGFVEYERRTGRGLANQGWKDSHDAIFHADGRLAQGPIALAEVQAYVYAAWRSAAESHCGWTIPSARPSAGTRPIRSAPASTVSSSTRRSARISWHSTATRSRAGSAPPMRATPSSPASPTPNARCPSSGP